jgi:hypothetical protein
MRKCWGSETVSFSRKRESREPRRLKARSYWIPAFAGMTHAVGRYPPAGAVTPTIGPIGRAGSSRLFKFGA